MNTIVIKTQKELDALPDSFQEYTRIEIRSTARIIISKAWENSSVEAWGNSSVVARENSRVEAWGNSSVVARGNSSVVARENSSVVARENSRVEAWENSSVVARENSSVVARGNSSVVAWENSRVDVFLLATLFVCSTSVVIRSLLDNAHLIYKNKNCNRPIKQEPSAKITEYEEIITPTFEQWLERGYVVADGIHQKLVSQKTIGEVTIFEVSDFSGKKKSFVAKKGDKFAHGETLEQAKADLRYKISDRNTSKFKSWKKTDIKPVEQLIEAYMTITGACSIGTKMFCEEGVIKKEEYSIKEVIKLTSGRYGNETFAAFFN